MPTRPEAIRRLVERRLKTQVGNQRTPLAEADGPVVNLSEKSERSALVLDDQGYDGSHDPKVPWPTGEAF